MAEQVQKLKAFFKRRENILDEDGGDDNTYGEYWEFQEPDEVESWSIQLNPMTGWAHFVHKFKSSPEFLSILYDERIKDVLYKRLGTVLIHCITIDEDPYMFTICIEYSKSPFDLIVFLKSLENSQYKRLMKDIKALVDKKDWVTKDGLPLKAISMASKVRQTIISLDVVTATNRSIADQMKAIDLTTQLASQGGSIGSTLSHAHASRAQGAASTRSQVVIPSTSK